MNIYEFAKKIGAEIEFTFNPRVNWGWHIILRDIRVLVSLGESMNDFSRNASAVGKTRHGVMKNYVRWLRGKKIKTEDGTIYIVPENLRMPGMAYSINVFLRNLRFKRCVPDKEAT